MRSSVLVRLDLSGSAMERTLVKKLSIGVEHVHCTPFGLILLSSDGHVHTVCYNDAEPTLRPVKCLASVRAVQIAIMPGSNFCAILSSTGQVHMWPWLEDRDGALVTSISDKDVVQISCGDDYGCVCCKN